MIPKLQSVEPETLDIEKGTMGDKGVFVFYKDFYFNKNGRDLCKSLWKSHMLKTEN